MANNKNLKPWKPGQSGNPSGKPRGTKHLSSWIKELMEDEQFNRRLIDGSIVQGAPIKAVVQTVILKAIDGDLRAFDLLGRYGYGTKLELTSKDEQLPVPILGALSKDIHDYTDEELDKEVERLRVKLELMR